MSMVSLAISCLTTFNLSWFMDLTFQVPMQYCSLQHQTLLPSPVTSTTGCGFCFSSISSFFLEFFLHWSPVSYWAPTDLGNSSFSIFYCVCCVGIFLLWLHLFILSGVISPLFSSSILGTYWPEELIFQCLIFFLFILLLGFSRQECWSGFPFPSPVDRILSELFTMTRPSCMALNGMIHSFIELCKPLCHDKAVIHEGTSP